MSKYVEVANLPSLADVDHPNDPEVPLVWNFALPTSVDAERILVNTSYLSRLHRIGAISSSIVTSYEGDLSQTMPLLTGINPDSSAVAGRSIVTAKADTSRNKLTSDSLVTSEIGHVAVWHDLNKPELADRVVDLRGEGKSSEQAWANVLDVSIRESMANAALKHLTERSGFTDRLVATWFTGTVIGINAIALTVGKEITPLAALNDAVYLFLQGRLKVQSLRMQKQPVRWSIFPYYTQRDRYSLLKAASLPPGLVKSAK